VVSRLPAHEISDSDGAGMLEPARPSSRQHAQVLFDRIAGGVAGQQKWLEKATDAISTYCGARMGRKRAVETFDPARLRARQACNDNASKVRRHPSLETAGNDGRFRPPVSRRLWPRNISKYASPHCPMSDSQSVDLYHGILQGWLVMAFVRASRVAWTG